MRRLWLQLRSCQLLRPSCSCSLEYVGYHYDCVGLRCAGLKSRCTYVVPQAGLGPLYLAYPALRLRLRAGLSCSVPCGTVAAVCKEPRLSYPPRGVILSGGSRLLRTGVERPLSFQKISGLPPTLLPPLNNAGLMARTTRCNKAGQRNFAAALYGRTVFDSRQAEARREIFAFDLGRNTADAIAWR